MSKHRFFNFGLISFVLMILCADVVRAEAFGNSSIAIPRLGMAFFDSPLLYHKKPWGLTPQWTIGTAFLQSINYRWWWIAETSFGFGKLTAEKSASIGSFAGGGGLRYNIFEGDFRPHLSVTLHYLHLLGENTRTIPLDLGWPIFVGLKPAIGLEWLFYSEMALLLEGSYALYVNVNEPFRQVLYAHAAYAIYF